MKKPYFPYSDSINPFDIGLRPLDLSNWIEVDDQLAYYLQQKQQLLSSIPNKVFVEEDGSQNAQQEVLSLLVDHLSTHCQQSHTISPGTITINNNDLSVNLNNQNQPALLTAASLVQEDLVIMRNSPKGWRLIAASVCFPSSWKLLEKFGKPLDSIHQPVPDFGSGTRNASLIDRVFNHLPVEQPAERFNWSIYGDDNLYHATENNENSDDYYLRVERQTLRKLPQSGDILFTIRIHLDPLQSLSTLPNKNKVITQIIETINTLTDKQLAYKGLDTIKHKVIKQLQNLA